jgi:hypothetical protein
MTERTPYDFRSGISRPMYYDKEYRPTIKVDNKQITDLFNLVGNMNINEVKQFMIMEQIPYSIVDNNNNTLIHRVLLDNDLSKSEIQRLHMIKFLFNENVNPDGPNNNNLTPLHIACSKQYYHIIKYLIEIGVNVNYQDNFGNTPLHRLFSGGIKIEEKTTISNLIAKPKKKDSINSAKWTEERIKIWDDIKETPFITAITDTLRNSIGSSQDEIEVVKDFQEQFLQMNLSLDKPEDIKKLKELQASSINKFKGVIEKRWNMLPNIEDIVIHPTASDSFPQNDPSKLAIIKKSDTKEYIKNTLYEKINEIKGLLSGFNYNNLTFDSNIVNNALIAHYLTEHPACLVPANMASDHTPHYNNFNNIFKYKDSIDFADNIIDREELTFIGGARSIFIDNNVDNNLYQQLFSPTKNIDHIIPTILYTLVVPFATATNFNGTYNLMPGNRFDENIIILLSEIINNNYTQERIEQIKHNILRTAPIGLPLFSLNQLLDNLNAGTDNIKWLYCFINNYVCIKNFFSSGFTASNLIGEIPISIMYLIAAMINNKGGKQENLILSLSQCMRKSLFINIYNESNNRFGFFNLTAATAAIMQPRLIGCLISALIYLIFATDYINFITNITHVLNPTTIDQIQTDLFNLINHFNESDQLKLIMKYSFIVMNNMPVPADMMIPTNDLTINLDPREILISIISKHYNSMEQPPQMQMVADLIDLIRRKKDFDEIPYEVGFRSRLRNFIQPVYDNISTIPDDTDDAINPNLKNIISNMRTSKYFTIIGDNFKSSNLWNIVNNSLPSRVNYYLASPDESDDPIINTENMKMYTLKFIESYYLGLNFLGQVQPLEIIPDIDITIGRTLNNFTTNYNLFNFDNHLVPAVPPAVNPTPEITTDVMYYTFNAINFNRPTTIMSVVNTLLHTETNLNYLINIITQRLLFVFTRMGEEKATSLYATAISYLYPDLLILNNYSKIFESINKKIKSYSNIFDTIEKISEIDISDNINNFTTFRLKKFESLVNQINGYIYLLHYFSSNSDKIKIPSFIYHALGSDKPLVVFDSDRLHILNPDSTFIGNDTYIDRIETKAGHINRDIGFYSDIINNIGYTTKETLRRLFTISKNKKLPPSLNVVLTDFYRLNIVETIKNNQTIINDIIDADVNTTMKNIQLLYLKSKIIEELIQLYIKNKIHEFARDIYNQLIRNRIPTIQDTQTLFETIDFSVKINEQPSNDFINNLSITTQSGLKLYYSFVEPKKIKEQFYIYPDNYFGSNLLKTKYTININLDIIELMLSNNSNILIHNNEKVSPLVMMIKNNYYDVFNTNAIKDNFDMNVYNNNNYSPMNYLIENLKNHLDNYDKKMSESQYNEMVNIIQSNEAYNNNILKYMDVSFEVVKYIVHQYLTENMIRFSDDFNSGNLKEILRLCKFNDRDINIINTIGQCQYNENLGFDIFIPNADENIIINSLVTELIKQISDANKILTKYNKERRELISLKIPTTNIDAKILNITNKLTEYTNQKDALEDYGSFFPIDPRIINDTKIIHRYNTLLNSMGNTYICYMEGWKQFTNINNNTNIERIPIYLINFQNTHNNNININILHHVDTLHPFYKHNNNIIKTYFENQRYIEDNKVLGFVYDLLVHLTKTFICSNIESIIKKVLYEYIISSQKLAIDVILQQINLMTDGIDEVLYDIIPKKFVRNSVGIYFDNNDEMENPLETVAEILNNLMDLLKTSSYISINDYTINILKNSINPYFDTITYKLINNWNVVIENIFLFHINQYRILECIKALNI